MNPTDLILIGQPSLSSAVQVGGTFNDTDGHSLAGTHDGIGQDGSTQANTAFTYNSPVEIKYYLNTNPATGGSATGYDITGASLVAGWPSAGMYAQQWWNINVATVAAPTTFTLLAPVSYNPFPGSLTAGYSHVAPTDSTGVLATGVVAVDLFLRATLRPSSASLT